MKSQTIKEKERKKTKKNQKKQRKPKEIKKIADNTVMYGIKKADTEVKKSRERFNLNLRFVDQKLYLKLNNNLS